MEDRRNTLIDLFCAHRGKNYMPSKLHKAIHWSAKDPFLEWKEYGDWRIVDLKKDCTNAMSSQPPSMPVQNAPLEYNALALKCKFSQVIPKYKHPIIKKIKYNTSSSTDTSNPLRLDLPLGTSWSNI